MATKQSRPKMPRRFTFYAIASHFHMACKFQPIPGCLKAVSVYKTTASTVTPVTLGDAH
ncbi:hypothetical protein [Burkholderia sp. TSV86]|uniref:hypothetical protein n=1 Tax=Burkholderia sp. TSV86 TaxID=1385594 RepID=UPI0012E33445|nr:hypothetical protein [Burkholderia sp. TSV86]